MATSSHTPKINSHLPSPSKTLLTKQAMRDYVYFSDNTKGHTGKAVKIKIDLFPRFAALVDPKTHAGQIVIRQIESLRMANGATSGVRANINSPFRFMLKVENMQVFYAVLDGEEQGRKEVFIGDIKTDFAQGNDKAGLYVYHDLSGKVKNFEKAFLDGKSVYVNGQCAGLDEAMENAQKRINATNENLAVFYVPGNVINELGVWSSASQLQQAKESINNLSDILKFNRDKKLAGLLKRKVQKYFLVRSMVSVEV